LYTSGCDYDDFYKLRLPKDSRTHGYLTPDTVFKLPWTADFSVDHKDKIIQVAVANDQADAINAAFQAVIDGAIALGPSVFANLTSHSEMVRILGARDYPSTAVDKPQPIRLERFAAPLFGICSRGAHLTAYVRDNSQPVSTGLRVWVARRAANLHTFPGMLDTTVAGGVKAEDTPRQCIVAESDEEAALPLPYVEKNIVPTGVVTYVSRAKQTGQLRPDILYVYDLELEEDMRPEPKDGEVQEFYLMTVEQVTAAMMNGDFKPNCCLVMLDFFVRHGIITENDKDYLDIVTGLRRRLPMPVTSQGL
jgi:8-oxo-dGTP pyrophosphatase MutT (NUDIX family)